MSWQALPLRLLPGQDLRASLAGLARQQGVQAAFVVQGIGSLQAASLRLAGAREASCMAGDFEILSLAGSLWQDGAHLHMSLADAAGRVLGGHVAPGCIVRTTAEILVALLPAHRFERQHDPASGFAELLVAVREAPHG